MRTIWACIAATLPRALAVDCAEAGEYDHNAAGGNSGPAWKHCRDTGHPTITHIRPWKEAA